MTELEKIDAQLELFRGRTHLRTQQEVFDMQMLIIRALQIRVEDLERKAHSHGEN